MSKEHFIEFYSKYVHPNQDLKAELAKASSQDEFMKILSPMAREAGVEFTMQDVEETVRGEMEFVLKSLQDRDDTPLEHREEFFNPLGSRILSMGNDMGTCHC